MSEQKDFICGEGHVFEMFYGSSMAFCPDYGLSENRKEKVKGVFMILYL